MRGKLRALGLAALSAYAILSAGAASATVVLDQYSVPETGLISATGVAGDGIGDPVTLAQSFTVGRYGELAAIDVGVVQFLGSPGLGFTFELHNQAAQVLFSQHIDGNAVPGFALGVTDWSQILHVDLSAAHIPSYAGDILTFFMISDTGAQGYPPVYLEQIGNELLQYARGDLFSFAAGGPPIYAPYDGAFRTYVDAVPEPMTWALMIGGLGMIGWRLRRSARPSLR